ncbi:MAG: type II secretion system GspH family protein [Candidatus Peribacteria bacterium]|jgi:prepilin-type N-terminal cleavage/methylation domain-containing protein|nr:type II secretion system GspH family protein [Candidatus Peribacteria bacterium]
MEKRKITKFSPLCPSDIFPYKGATKQEVTPLYKGRLGGVCAFTLVELIVVISILAIL